MQVVLVNTLRLYPVFPVLARVALKDTKLPVGGGKNQTEPVFVPRGTNVIMSYYAIHHDANIYGDDVEEFIPGRWDHIHPDQYQFLPFGAGQRACLGQPKALVEAAYVVARLAERYEILECRDKEPWEGEIKLTCKSANGCKVAFRKE
ncbi:hypothetical protein HYALB_00012718 [Hymenoscyphus albidus]|uniref:Cytochrome P450 n=1 Tax=Hymenoscyphus albidus TaxID=595503 RepID=A0A9N9LP62_9HELO|nr:hypothetical protein HYALB_00012718 [Hymenoscyphus albidus]